MNSEPSSVTPSAFSIWPRTLTAAPLVSVQATTMSPLRSCVTADRFWSPAIVVLTVRWDPSFARLIAHSCHVRLALQSHAGCRRRRIGARGRPPYVARRGRDPGAAALPAAAHSGGDRLERCPLAARKALAVRVLRVQTRVTAIAQAVSARRSGASLRLTGSA